MAFDLSEYVTVNERIALAMDKWPDASFQNIGTKLIEVAGHFYVEATVALYRDPNDVRPAIATAWEPIPGATPYTKDSEMMNAETSAMGRAVIAAGIPSKKVASAEEVANRQHLKAVPSTPPPTETTDPWSGEIVNAIPTCLHGEMKWNTGVSKKTGKDYAGYFCAQPAQPGGFSKDGCPTIWYVMGSDGNWKPQS